MSDQRLTPRELAMKTLGYVPERTPETWEDVQAETQQLAPIVYINGSGWDMRGRLSLDKIKEIYAQAGVPIVNIGLPPKDV